MAPLKKTHTQSHATDDVDGDDGNDEDKCCRLPSAVRMRRPEPPMMLVP